MLGYPIGYWIGAAMVIGGLAWSFRDWVGPALGSIPSGISNWWNRTSTTTTVAPADQDVADLAALKIVQARYKRLNCPEGQKAVAELFEHFFHGVGA